MEKLISRWNRKKAQAIAKARVFHVEERDDCLHLTKRLTTIFKRAAPSFGIALLFCVWSWRTHQESPTFETNWFGIVWPIAVGLTMMIVPVWEMWGAYRGDVWVFNRQSQQIKHGNLLVMSLKSLKRVEVHRITDSDNPDYFRLAIIGREQFELLDQEGMESEYLEIGQRIADFAQIPLIRHQ